MNRSRGVAVITAMLIAALAGTLAAGLKWDSTLDIRRTMVMLYRDQAIQVAIGSEGWVQSILRDDLAQSQSDHLDEIWATDLPPLPIDAEAVQGTIYGRLEDLQGRFNVNNLVDRNGEPDPVVKEQFERLLMALSLEANLAGAVIDWIDSNQEEEIPYGAEDPLYSSLTPAYRTANRMISNITELAAVNGMDALTFEILLPHVISLPGQTPINVNTATGPVLQSLGPNITTGDAQSLLEQREGGGFVNYNDVFDPFLDKDLKAKGNVISETSNYFQLLGVVQIDTVRVSLFTTLYRSPQGDVVPILRKLGTI